MGGFQKIHFTYHGLHLNGRGKNKLAHAIINAITLWHGSKDAPQGLSAVSPTKKVQVTDDVIINALKTSSTTMSPTKMNTAKPIITILETNMTNIIDKYRNNKDIAFAHCISADFNHHKHMSEGVAVSFKHKFGRPCYSDYCDKNLTLQKNNQGASIYSLVTKPNYFLNSTNFEDYIKHYDLAFEQLTVNFKKQKLRTLICSPMGCIRDRIMPKHFIRNLNKFQSNTGASIFIVTSNENPKGHLHNRMSHTDFVTCLHQLITPLQPTTGQSSTQPRCGNTSAVPVPSTSSSDCLSACPQLLLPSTVTSDVSGVEGGDNVNGASDNESVSSCDSHSEMSVVGDSAKNSTVCHNSLTVNVSQRFLDHE